MAADIPALKLHLRGGEATHNFPSTKEIAAEAYFGARVGLVLWAELELPAAAGGSVVTTNVSTTPKAARSTSTSVHIHNTAIAARPKAARAVPGSIRKLTFDAASATTTVNPSSITYRVLQNGAYEITVTPRLTYAGNNSDTADKFGWRTAHFKVSGINGAKIVVKINGYLSDTAGVASNFVKAPWASNDNGCYSYDRATWTYFNTASSRDPTTTHQVTLTHTLAFAADDVWVSKYPRVGTADELIWIQSFAAANPTLVGDVTGGSSFVAATYSAQTDELARTIPACPLLAYRISDASLPAPSGKKKIALFYSGVHATEEGGQLALRKAAEFIVSSDPKALIFRRYFDVLIFPLVNAPGRNGGHYRAQFQSTANAPAADGADLQWHYTDVTPDFETVSVSRAAAITALNGQKPDLFIDWHSKYNGTYGVYTNGNGQAKVTTKVQAYLTVGIDGASGGSVTDGYWGTYPSVASFTPENPNQDGSGTPAELLAWGEAWIKASTDWLTAGGFSVDPVARVKTRSTNTESKIATTAPASRVKGRAAMTSAPVGGARVGRVVWAEVELPLPDPSYHMTWIGSRVTTRSARGINAIKTTSVSARAKSRSADTYITISQVSVAARLVARGASSYATTSQVAVAGRVLVRGASTSVTISTVGIASRTNSRSASSAAPLGGTIHTTTVSSRARAASSGTFLHIRNCAITAKQKQRASEASAKISAVALIERVRVRAARTVATTRTSTASSRVRARVTVAPHVIQFAALMARLKARAVSVYVAADPIDSSEERTYPIAAEGRGYIIETDSRGYDVVVDQRSYTVATEQWGYLVDPDNRSFGIDADDRDLAITADDHNFAI